jgi:LacI family transcriptional regulator
MASRDSLRTSERTSTASVRSVQAKTPGDVKAHPASAKGPASAPRPTVSPIAPVRSSPTVNKPVPVTTGVTKHVALLIETTGSYGRGLLQGVARYNREHGRWSTYFRPHGIGDPPPSWIKNWKGDGILARVTKPETAKLLISTGLPIVNLRGSPGPFNFPFVTADQAEISTLAENHLRDRGLKHFAFCGRPAGVNPTLDDRCAFFRKSIESTGQTCHVFPAVHTSESAGWEEEQERLVKWLLSLPKPVGIMAANDERGLQVLDACRRAELVVPDEVAVIGVDNDAALCELSIPPLTSVDVHAEGIGYEAAALLDKIMSGKLKPAPKPMPIKIPPRCVVVRRSTDTVASEDEEVGRAIRYIRANACKSLQVVDVLAFMGMSRASLQQRMKAMMGRTIHQEIQRVRMGRAQELLVNSDLTIKQIARESGFASVQYMTRVFRATIGETPALYRRNRSKPR